MRYYTKIRVFKSLGSLSQQFFFGLVTKPSFPSGGQGTRVSVALVAVETRVILKDLLHFVLKKVNTDTK